MRKSKARTGVRPFRVGIAAATAAVVVAGTVTAALAATTATLNWTQIPTQGGLAVTVTATGAFPTSGGTLTGRLVGGTGATCTATPAAVSASATPPVVDTGPVTRSTDDIATFATPPVAANIWKLCIYDTSNVLVANTTGSVTAVPFGTLNTATGPAGVTSTITLTATGAYPSTVTTVGTEFSTSQCADKYTAPSGTSIIAATTTTKTSVNLITITVPASLTPATGYWVCAYNGTAANSSTLLARSGITFGTYASTLPTGTVAPPAGNSGGENNITLTTAANTITGATPGALFTRNSCPALNVPGSGAEPYTATVQKITTGKVAITVPTGVVVGPRDATTPWNVCLYSSTATSGTLLAVPVVYTVAPVLLLTSAVVAPSQGPSQGGTPVTITGLQGIPTAEGATLSATLGGSPLQNVKAIDAVSISGVTTAHSAGLVALSITTAAGTKTSADEFTYTYGITVMPNSAPPLSVTGATNPTLDIMGAGFSNLAFADFASGTAAVKAHVLLVDNAWYAQAGFAAAGVDAFATVAPITQCIGVLPIGDNELVCTLDLDNGFTTTGPATTGTNVPPGTYTVTVVNSGSTPPLTDVAQNFSVISSGSTFTVAAF